MIGPLYVPNSYHKSYTCKYCNHIKMGSNTSGYGCAIQKDLGIISPEYRTPDKCPLLAKTIRKRKLKKLNSYE